MDGMFTATTAPQTFSTPSMNGVAFGSVSARFPTQNFNIVAFDPPRLNAGCSGIDMYMGSFSFINSDQLKTMLRAISQGAIGFAFKAALRSVSGVIAATLDDLQAITQQMNAMGRNTCALSKMVGDSMSNMAGIKEKGEKTESLLSSAKSTVQGWWAGMEKTRLGSKSDSANQYNGNLVFRALYNSQAPDRFGSAGGTTLYGMNGDLPDLIIGLVGTTIVSTGGNDSKACSAGSEGSDCGANPQSIVGTIEFDHVLNGKGDSDGRVTYWKCDTKDSEMGCQKPTEAEFQFEGTKRYVLKMIFGEGGTAFVPTADSIMGVMKSSGLAGLTNSQKNFLAGVQSIPLMQIIYRTQRDRNVAQALLSRSADYIAHDMAYKIVFNAIVVAERAFSSNTVVAPEDLRNRLAHLKSDIERKGYNGPKEVLEFLKTVEDLQKTMEQNFPKANALSWMKR